MTGQLAHTNRAGVENTSLPLIVEPLGPEIIMIGGLQPFRCTLVSLDDTTSKPPDTHSNQATNTFSIWGNGDWNAPLGSLDSRPEVQR